MHTDPRPPMDSFELNRRRAGAWRRAAIDDAWSTVGRLVQRFWRGSRRFP